jgi:chromosome segregation and condensation protein ScpB
MAGRGDREGREAQGQVLRAVLLAGDEGMTEEELAAGCEGLSAAEIEAAVEALIATGLLERIDSRLHPSGPATRFERLRPL